MPSIPPEKHRADAREAQKRVSHQTHSLGKNERTTYLASCVENVEDNDLVINLHLLSAGCKGSIRSKD
jgi:hypothetical protein